MDGNEFIDYILGMGAAALGHSPAPLLARVAAAQQDLQCPAGQQPAEVELARKIVSLVPSAQRVRVGCTGSEMVQLALRLARAATGRSLVVKFEGHYHGWFDSTFSGTTEMPAEGEYAAPVQTPGQSPGALADLAVLPWNDLAVLETFVAAHNTEVAALIMEPVLCNTSVIVPRPGYLEGVRRLCDNQGIVLIFDEVITGFRLDPGGAQAMLGVAPDLTVMGKALGAGFPVAGLAGRASLMDLLGRGGVMHGGTYNANAMAVTAALAALDVLADADGSLHRRSPTSPASWLRASSGSPGTTAPAWPSRARGPFSTRPLTLPARSPITGPIGPATRPSNSHLSPPWTPKASASRLGAPGLFPLRTQRRTSS